MFEDGKFLLKPVNPEQLATAIERLSDNKEGIEDQIPPRPLEIDDRLLLEINERAFFLRLSVILHISAAGDYTEIFIIDAKATLVEKPLREWEMRLPEKYFTRIHRSTIINLNEVEKLETLFNRTMEVQFNGFPQTLPVSRRYAIKLKEKFG